MADNCKEAKDSCIGTTIAEGQLSRLPLSDDFFRNINAATYTSSEVTSEASPANI